MKVLERTSPALAEEGTLGPIAAGTLAAGAVALALVLGGTIGVVASYGFTPYTSIVTALQSDTTAMVIIVGMILGAAASLAGYATYRRMPTKQTRERAIAGAVLGIQAVVLGAVLLWFRTGNPDRFTFHFLNFEVLEGSFGRFLLGARNTVLLAVVGEAGGIVIGLVLALLALSKRRVVRAPARVYINFFRGTPLVWQLSVTWFLFLFAFEIRALNAFQVAMLVFALNTGAYAAEVFRAGIQSIERGQMEAARSLGMSYLQAMRYAIVPQAVRRVIPPLMNEFVILIKDTSLILVLGLQESQLDLFSVAREGQAATFNSTFFVAAAIGYLMVTLPLIRAVSAVERRLRSGLVGVV